MSWGAIGAAAVTVVGGSLMGGGGGGGGQQPAYTDPFGAANRTAEQQRLMNLQANPTSVTQLPGYQFGLTSGVETLNRNYAATGQGGSGAQQVALQQFSQNYAGSQYQNEMSNLSQLSGATQGQLSNASQNNLNYQMQQDQQSNQAGMFNALGQGAKAAINQWGPSSMPNNTQSVPGLTYDAHSGTWY